MKRACFGLWRLIERGILYLTLKCACFTLGLIERGMLHLGSAKLLENRGRRKRGEMTGYSSVARTKWHIFLRLSYFKTLWDGYINEV